MTPRRRQAVVFSLIFLIVFGWGLSLMLAFPEHVGPVMLFAILLPVIPTGMVLSIQSRSVPQNILNKIHEISLRVEKDLEQERIAIDTRDIPDEIMPFVTSINRLLSYHHDRYQQERDFTAHASHELRTPLAGIRLQTELAMATGDNQRRENALRNVLKSIDRSTRLVEQLLTISRLTSEKVDLARETVDLVALFRRVAADNSEPAHRKQIDLSFTADAETVPVNASEDSLNIMADNLIRNAIAHTPVGGRIAVALSHDDSAGHSRLVIEDNGPGIPEHLRERVMRRFEKGDAGAKTGTGLGLAIVKRILDLHGGGIVLRDAADGHGLRVEVSLPDQGDATQRPHAPAANW